MVLALAHPQNTADGLLTLSPVPVTCKSAPVPWNPRPPVMRRPFRLDAEAVVRELALRAVVLTIDGCFPFNALTMLVPCTVSDPDSDVLPVTANVEFKIAAPSACSSRVATTSRPWMSALVVRLATLRALLVVSAACFPWRVMLRSTPAR